MSDAEAARLAEERKLIFQNLANGVAPALVAAVFHYSEAELSAAFKFVARKIVSYRFRRALPYLPCATVGDARAHRGDFLHVLDRLNLKTEPEFKVESLPMQDALPKIMAMASGGAR